MDTEKGRCIVFERVTATRWRLTKDARKQIATIIIYMRNEWVVTAANIADQERANPSKQQVSTAANYYKMAECCDRILSRLNTTFDAHKLTHVFGEVARMVDSPEHEATQRSLIAIAETLNAADRLDPCGDRIGDTGHDQLAGETGPEALGPADSK